ncbi:MAG TPA: hypothetical protein VNT30_00340 [Stellaceae bacterium]|nr:hypothetical protein [Stellaceae bacterium]
MRAGIYWVLALSMGLAAVSGCADERKAATPGENGISYRLGDGDLDNTDRRASTYCTHIGLRSQLRGVSGEPGQRVAIYDCV